MTTHPLRESARRAGRVVYLELVTLVFSLLSLGTLTLELLVPLDASTLFLLRRLDDFICLIFLFDFGVHFWMAPSKMGYLKWGWIDLISSIPELQMLRWGRMFRVLRILRAIRSFQELNDHLFEHRPRGTFGLVGLLSLIAVMFATVAVFELERSVPEANIHQPGDALWWAFATITTIGYGDHYPVTFAGRAVAVLLVVFGLSLFSTFTAYVASFFLEKTQLKEETEIHHLIHEVRRLREKIEKLEATQHGVPAPVSSLTNQPPQS